MTYHPKSTFAKVMIALALIGGLVAFAGYFSDGINSAMEEALSSLVDQIEGGNPTATGRSKDFPAGKPEFGVDEVGAIFDRAFGQYEKDYRTASASFERVQLLEAADYARRSRKIFATTLEKEIGHKSVCHLVYLMAKDMVAKESGNRDMKWVEANLIHPVKPTLKKYHRALDTALSNMEQEQLEALSKMENNLIYSIQAALPPSADEADPLMPMAEAFESELNKPGLLLRATLPAALVPLDVHALIPKQRRLLTESIHKSARSAYKRFAAKHLSSKAKRMAAALGGALLDGPLPLGDLIAAGLAGWTAWEMATFPADLRQDMLESYDEGLKQFERDIEHNILPKAREASEQYLAEVRQSRDQFIETILHKPALKR